MTAEHYIQEKDRLSQAMNGQDRLMEAVGDITKTLGRYNLDGMPETAFDVMRFILETIHLGKLNLEEFLP